VYGIVARPVKLFAGVKRTSPVVVLTVQVLPLASVKVVCCPAVPGSRSIVLTTIELPVPFAVSFAAMFGKVTGVLNDVVVLSSVAVGGAGLTTVVGSELFAGVGSPPPEAAAVFVMLFAVARPTFTVTVILG